MVQSYPADHSVWSRLALENIDPDNEGVFLTIKKGGQKVKVQVV